MTLIGPATLSIPTLDIQNSTTSQYIAAAGGATDASRAIFKFVSTGGTSTITELKFTLSGSNDNTVNLVKVGDVSAPVISGTAWLQGLAIPVSSEPELCVIL